MALGSGGRLVYVLRPGRDARRDDLVETLAAITEGRPATVAEQRANWRRRRDDRGRV